jgi:hypothetical protein
MRCLLLALFGHAAISELSLRSGVKRKLDLEPAKGSFWRKTAVRQRLWYIDLIPSYCGYDGDQRHFGRPGFLRSRDNGGSFACGEAPRWNVSMMSMRPP